MKKFTLGRWLGPHWQNEPDSFTNKYDLVVKVVRGPRRQFAVGLGVPMWRGFGGSTSSRFGVMEWDHSRALVHAGWWTITLDRFRIVKYEERTTVQIEEPEQQEAAKQAQLLEELHDQNDAS